jgi:hypothetical protein
MIKKLALNPIFVTLIACSLASLSSVPAQAQSEIPDQPIVLDLAEGGCSPVTEICGDSIDQDCDGADLLCSGTDQDRDGFTTNDCDDTNRNVYPGISVACSAACGTGTKTCQSSGAFSDCSCSALCEATGSGSCYYISQFTGSDSNSGSFQSPWKSFHNIKSKTGSSEQPPNYVALGAGDVVYVMSGTYDQSHQYSATERYAFFFRGLHATADNPITVKAYPGAHVLLTRRETGPSVYILQSSHIILEGFEVQSQEGDGIWMNEADSIEIRNVWVHDVDGVDNDNLSGVKFTRTTNSRLHHSKLHDNYDRTNADTGGSATQNSRNVVLFKGGNNRIDHSIIFQSPSITADKTGACVTYKHSQEVEDSIFEFDNNMMWNCKFVSVGSASFGTRIHHNLIINSEPIRLGDFGGPAHQRDVIIENNTLVNTPAIIHNPTDTYGAIGLMTFRDNIVVDNSSTYNSIEGLVEIYIYGSDAIYNTVVGGNNLSFSNNCYYNEGLPSPQFNLFSRNGGSNGSLGHYYTIEGWQGLGYDTNSSIAAPALDAYNAPTNPTCQNKGWLVP